MKNLYRYDNGKGVRGWRQAIADYITQAEACVPNIEDKFSRAAFVYNVRRLDQLLKDKHIKHRMKHGGDVRLSWAKEVRTRVTGLHAAALLLSIEI